MKKQIIFILTFLLILSTTSVFAYTTNPFDQVPRDHWAYSALTKLHQDGFIPVQNTSFLQNNNALTRYEMAILVAQISEIETKDNNLIISLREEFENELYNMGVKIDALEKSSSRIKFSGDISISYQRGLTGYGRMNLLTPDSRRSPSNFRQEVGINIEADITNNVKFYGEVDAQHINNEKN